MHHHCSWQHTPRDPGLFRLHLHLQLPLPRPHPQQYSTAHSTNSQVTPSTLPMLSTSPCLEPALPCFALPGPGCPVCPCSLPLLSCPILGVSSLSVGPLCCCLLPLLLFSPMACLAVPVHPAPSACPVSLSVWRCLSIPAVVPPLGQSWWRWLP
jgi:hypothetical protein